MKLWWRSIRSRWIRFCMGWRDPERVEARTELTVKWKRESQTRIHFCSKARFWKRARHRRKEKGRSQNLSLSVLPSARTRFQTRSSLSLEMILRGSRNWNDLSQMSSRNAKLSYLILASHTLNLSKLLGSKWTLGTSVLLEKYRIKHLRNRNSHKVCLKLVRTQMRSWGLKKTHFCKFKWNPKHTQV